jgi:hypothetical protein
MFSLAAEIVWIAQSHPISAMAIAQAFVCMASTVDLLTSQLGIPLPMDNPYMNEQIRIFLVPCKI